MSFQVFGSIDQDGKTITGKGFTVTKPGSGTYEITFSGPFPGIPAVVASPNTSTASGGVTAIPFGITKKKFSMLTSNYEGNPQDLPFAFFAIG